MDLLDRRRVAIHESGHAVTSIGLHGTLPGWLRVQPTAGALGRVHYPVPPVPPSARRRILPPRLWPDLIARLAGFAAELRFLGNAQPEAERTDRQQVLDALQATMRPSERAIEALVSYLTIEAEDFVTANLESIDRGAQILLERGRLTCSEFRRRLADA